MSGTALRVRIQRYIVSATLFAYAVWLWRQPGSAAQATVAIIAGGGVAANLRWSRFVVYALAAILAGEWFWILYRETKSGFLARHLSPMQPLEVVLAFAPGVLMFVLLGYCCYVAHRYVATSAHI